MGIVYAPALDRLFGAQDAGAFENAVIFAASGSRKPPADGLMRSRARPIEIKLPMIGCKPMVLAILLHLVIKFCLITAGEADAYPHLVLQWSGIQQRQMLYYELRVVVF